MKRSKIVCIGVGPGDPELLTLKAIRLIREADVVAVPGEDPQRSVAYKIAAGAVPEIAKKRLVGISMPMTKDADILAQAHREGAKTLENLADRGLSIAFLTLGDPTIYCTFSYLQHILEIDGYQIELVPGVTSMTAAAARLGISLTEWDEPLHVFPGTLTDKLDWNEEGTYVIMKSASRIKDIKDDLLQCGMQVQAVIDCGMDTERICRSPDDIPEDPGYFTLLIAKNVISPSY